MSGTLSQRTLFWMVCGVLAVLTWLAFGSALSFDFVNYDDGQYVYANEYISGGVTLDGVKWVLKNSHGGHWHPLTSLSHMLDCQLFGLNPSGHHLTSLLLHSLSAVFLFAALRRMSGAFWQSAFVAAIFAIHPLRAESVVWISERKDVLSGLFFMLTLWSYAGYARRPFAIRSYVSVVLFFVLGLLSKPMLVTVPFVLLLFDFWPLRRTDFRRLLLEKILLLMLSAVFCAVTVWAQKNVIVSLETSPVSWRLGNAVLSYFIYVKQLLVPTGLAVLYPAHTEALPAAEVAVAFFVLAAITLLAIVQIKKRPYLLTGWLLYLGTLVPVIGILQLGSQSHADRYTYLSHIGLLVIIVWITAEYIHNRKVLSSLLSMVVLTCCLTATRIQAEYWKDSLSLWTHTLQHTERNHIAHGNMGAALLMEGNAAGAVEHLEKAVALEPGEPELHNNLAVAYAETGRFQKASAAMQTALLLAKDQVEKETLKAMLLRLLEYQEKAKL